MWASKTQPTSKSFDARTRARSTRGQEIEEEREMERVRKKERGGDGKIAIKRDREASAHLLKTESAQVDQREAKRAKRQERES